jgi:hypothetical protein
MKVLQNLSAAATAEADGSAIRMGMAVHDEPVAGFIRQAKFGLSGLMLIAGESQLLVPMAELWKLAEANDPKFVPPSKAPLPKTKA